MQLDRNTNRGGHGKYALVNMRKIVPLLEARERCDITIGQKMELEAFEELVENGIITLGNETPGDQFFVMKYKDKFTAAALNAYAAEVSHEAALKKDDELFEYARQMFDEATAARELGNRIPD